MKKTKKSKEKNLDLITLYKESFLYIKDSKKFIEFVIALFAFFVLFGFFIPAPKFLENQIMNFLRDLIEQTKNMSFPELVFFLISNNVRSTFSGVILGTFFGILPIISTISNAYLLGFVSLISVNESGILSLWRILPHGIFELPAIFISLGLGLKLGTFVFQKEKLKCFLRYFIHSLKVFLLIVIPLLILAGIIESALMILFR